jgi:hypothetical protein
MFDAARAVELLVGATSPEGSHRGYGSGYIVGKGLVLTCSHIFSSSADDGSVPVVSGHEDVVARDIRGDTYRCRVEWLNPTADLAIVHIPEPDSLPSEPVVLGTLPTITTGVSMRFSMYGWPRAGDVKAAERPVREPFEVNGEIRLSEFAAAKTGRIRLRAAEQFNPLLEGSSWTGMSGAAVICGGAVVGVQVSQPQPGLPAYLSAQPLTIDALSWMDESGANGLELLQAANVEVGVFLSVPLTPDVAPRKSQARASRPYLLLETGTVIGRDTEREAIEAALAGTSGSFRLLVGIGGIGKSALAWDVWERLKAGRSPSTRQFWYSFYDGCGVGNFDAMLSELARFLDVDPPPEAAENSTSNHDYVADVLQALEVQPTVLVLDGLERCLRCYQRPLSVGDMEAIRADQTTDVAWNERDLGFANPDAYRLFASLLRQPNCQTIATSRVVPSELVSSGGAPRAGLLIEHLAGLSSTGTAGLLSAFGVDASREQAARIATSLGGHPLALSLLARRFSRSTSARRDLSSWLASEGYLQGDGPGPAELRQRLFASELSLLSIAARKALAVAGAMGGVASSALLGDVLSVRVDATDDVLNEIEHSGLGTLTPARDLACHALVSHAAFDALEPHASESLMRDLQSALAWRFESIDRRGLGTSYFEWFTEHGIADRIEAVALCKALIRLGRTSDASEMYREQLSMALRWSVAANIEAVELLEEIVGGLLPEETRPLKADLTHHLTLVGRLDDANAAIGDTADTDAMWFSELMAASHLALLRGELAESLRLSTAALHDARIDLNYAFGYDYSFFQLMGGKNLLDTGAPCSNLIEAACASMRVLVLDGWFAEAAWIWSEVQALWSGFHDQCDGCRGLLLRTAAEVLLECGHPELAQEALHAGALLQASQGKSLQGIFSHVLVVRGLTADAALEGSVSRTLMDGGFVLYELLVEAYGDPSNSDDQTRTEAALRSLAQIGCNLPHRPSQDATEEGAAPFRLSASLLADATAWIRFETFRRSTFAARKATSDSSDDSSRVEDKCREVMQRILDQGYPRDDGALDILAAGGDRRAITRIAIRAELDLARLPCTHEDPTLSLEGEGHNMRRRLKLNPRDGHALLHLAAASIIQDNIDECVARLRMFLYSTTNGFHNYQLAVDLAAQNDAVADQLVSILRNYAYDDHDPSAAYLALANLFWLTGDETEALRTHKVGFNAPAGLMGHSNGYAHECALFVFGEPADEPSEGEPGSSAEPFSYYQDPDLDLDDGLDEDDPYYSGRPDDEARARRTREVVQRFFECVRDEVPYLVTNNPDPVDGGAATEVGDDAAEQESFMQAIADQCARVVTLAGRVRIAAGGIAGQPAQDS